MNTDIQDIKQIIGDCKKLIYKIKQHQYKQSDRCKESQRKYYKNNIETIRAKDRERYKKRKDKMIEWRKQDRKDNPQKYKDIDRRARLKRKNKKISGELDLKTS